MPKDSTRIRITKTNAKRLIEWGKNFPAELSLTKLANMVLSDGRFPVYSSMKGQHGYKK